MNNEEQTQPTPHNTTSVDEKQLIAALMTDVEFTHNVIDILDYKFFQSEHAQMYFRVIKDGYKSDIFVNEDNIGSMFKKNFDTAATEVYLDIFKQDYKPYLSKDLTYIKKTTNNFIIKARQKYWFQVNQSKINTDKRLLTDDDILDLQETLIVEEMDKEYTLDISSKDFLKNERTIKIPTGFDTIDEKLYGGVSKGTFAMLIAYAGSGKTTLLTAIASNALMRRNKVLHVTFEDDVRSIYQKLITHRYNALKEHDDITGVNINFIDQIDEEFKQLPEGSVYHFIQKQKSLTTVRDIENHVKKFIQKNGTLDLLVIDYADLLFAKKDGNNGYENDQYIYRAIERLALKYNIVIWTATQANRSGANNENMESDSIGGSIKKVQIAPIVLSLGKTNEQKQMGCATVKLLKNRTGSDGFVYTNIVFNNGKMLIDFDKAVEMNASFEKTK